ncbi:MAG TPA: ATP-binding protein [Acidimicrobiales bacterium]|nr:ATP-binding protein [Acidimicrobiales bacterium]
MSVGWERPFPVPTDDDARVAALHALGLLGTAPEGRFDRIARSARTALQTEIALVSLVDRHAQEFKACFGIEAHGTARSESFCAYTIMGDDLFEVPDTCADPIFRDYALVTGPPHVRSYAGVALHGPGGHRVGTLCVLDTRPRRLDDRQRELLHDLAEWASTELGLADLRTAAGELEAVRSRLDKVLRSVAEGICVVDGEGLVRMANPAAEQLTEWSTEELAGRPLVATLMGQLADGQPRVDDPVKATLTDGATRTGIETSVWTRTGRQVPVACSVAAMVEGGAVTGAVVTIDDITRRQELDRRKDEFVSSVSHELRTPLTSIRGSLRLVEAGVLGELPAEAAEAVAIASRNAERLVDLVNDILDLERMRTGRVELVRSDTDVAGLVTAAAAALGPVAEAGGIRVQVSCPPIRAWVDPGRMHQVLVNLLSNAIKYSPEGSTVTVTGEVAGDWARLTVRDQGRGIPADRLERIFERFEQVEAADSRGGRGTGLGLAITRHVVDAHGGRIWADSRPGEGSAFTVVVPVEPSQP